MRMLINGRRSRFEILADILRLAREEAKKTRILYQANLNHAQLQRYLAFLTDKGFLERQDNPHIRYKTTEKGLKFLSMFQKIDRYLK